MNLHLPHFISTLIFFFLFSLTANAQQKNQIQWGKQIKNNSKANLDKIITQDGTGFYVLKTWQGNQDIVDGPKEVFIEHYNREMNLTKSTEIDLKWKKKKRQFEDILMIGGELYLFTSFNNQAKRKNFLFAQKINKTNFKIEQELKYIAEIDTKSKFKEGSFSFHLLQRRSLVLRA